MSARKIVSDKQIVKDYETMSSGEMAQKYGVARGTVCKHLKRLGVTRPLAGLNSRNKKRNGEVIKTGYPVTHLPGHPRASAAGYVFKHILEVERQTGKLPSRGQPIHHIDLDRLNYKIENLYQCKSYSEHQKAHNSLLKCAGELIKKGAIVFENGEYHV